MNDAEAGLGYAALGFRFSMGGAVADEHRSLFESFADGSQSADVARSSTVLRAKPDGQLALSIDSCEVFRTFDLGALIHHTVWEITRRAVATRPHSLVLHAGAVVVGGTTCVICGPSGAGKSTLVASLMFDGARYLTDEAVEFDDSGAIVDAVCRPIHLSGDSLRLLGLDRVPRAVRLPGGGGYLPVVNSVATSCASTKRTVIVVLGPGGGDLRVSTPRASDVAVHLVNETFGPRARTQAGLESVKKLVARSTSIALSGGTVAHRANAVRRLV